MPIIFPLLIFSLIPICSLNGQSSFTIYGKIIGNSSKAGLSDSEVLILNDSIKVRTDTIGNFLIKNLLERNLLINISKYGYTSKKFPFHVNDSSSLHNVGIIGLDTIINEKTNLSLIELSDQDLVDENNGENMNITGVLRSSKDTFTKTAAYDFSPTFFRPRHLASEYLNITLNGTSLNKISNGRPQWANFGGLNDVLRNQEYNANLAPSNLSFGGIAGTLNFNTQASGYHKGFKISVAASNRSYTGRLMATFSSGLSRNGWAFAISSSGRFAREGYREGTFYKAYSFLTSIENRITSNNRLNVTFIYAKNQRGKSSPLTMEIYNYKGKRYNSYWGDDGNKKRNARQVNIEEPIIQLNHFWNNNLNNFNIQTNITYQFGKSSYSRLDYNGTRIVKDDFGNKSFIGGGVNPDPTYYQKLPSYYLRNNSNLDYTNAYLSQQNFLGNSQIEWSELIKANMTIKEDQGNSIYTMYDDIKEEKQLNFKSMAHWRLNKNISFVGSVGYKNIISNNYAMVSDLLGGEGFLDVDAFNNNVELAQNNLGRPDRIVIENQKFKYNYILETLYLGSFMQGNYQGKRSDAFLSIFLSTAEYQREGLFENGTYPGSRSLGKGPSKQFLNYGIKGGLTYKFNGRNIIILNGSYLTKAPHLDNSFQNIRKNNDLVGNLRNETNQVIDFAYFFRHPKIRIRFSTYWIAIKEKTQNSFYFANGLTELDRNEKAAFVREILTNIDHENAGLEFAIETSLLPKFKLKAVAAFSRSIYKSNPNLQIVSDRNMEPINYGKAYIKNYHVPGGPQQAYSIGLEYNGPSYWWLGSSVNYFSNAYVSISSIKRTKNFYTDSDGLPINEFNPIIANKLLKQEVLDPYYLVNMVAGKSWKIDKYYLSFFLNVSNILNTTYKTGGYEQSRNVNYTNLLTDKNRSYPLFDSKYWFGYGTSFFLSLTLRR